MRPAGCESRLNCDTKTLVTKATKLNFNNCNKTSRLGWKDMDDTGNRIQLSMKKHEVYDNYVCTAVAQRYKMQK